MCYSTGGAAFLIPYFFSFFFIAVPLFLIETAYGQMIDLKLHERWGVIVPRLWGVKIVQLFICFGTCIYYITLMAWSFSFFFASFKGDLPWVLKTAKDGQSINDLWNESYFYDQTLQRTKDINTQGGLIGELVGCLILAYVVTYFSAWKGLKSTGKMVYVTCLLPYIILTILLIRGLTLDGCGEGLKFLFVPNWEIVGKTETWKASAIQILFSSGVAYGPLMYYGSAREKDDKIVSTSFWVPFANSATSLYAALTIFSFLGHVSVAKEIPIDQVATSGPTLLFVAFPSLLALLPGANFWAVIFFIMCVCLGVDSVFGFFDYYIKFAQDWFPELEAKMRKEY
jgi:SNF family Na+-dependent transporter